jgi:hypothetical protein
MHSRAILSHWNLITRHEATEHTLVGRLKTKHDPVLRHTLLEQRIHDVVLCVVRLPHTKSPLVSICTRILCVPRAVPTNVQQLVMTVVVIHEKLTFNPRWCEDGLGYERLENAIALLSGDWSEPRFDHLFGWIVDERFDLVL